MRAWLAALAAAVLIGCAASEPVPSYKQAARVEQYKLCVNTLMGELYEEIQAGFYTSGDLMHSCRQWAERRVP